MRQLRGSSKTAGEPAWELSLNRKDQSFTRRTSAGVSGAESIDKRDIMTHEWMCQDRSDR